MVKTAILVSGGGLNLQSILDAKLFGELPECEIIAVISSKPEAYAVIRAEAALVPTYIIDRDLFPNEEVFSQAVNNKLKDLDTELVVLAGYDYPLPPSVFKRFAGRIIDTCPRLLPIDEDSDATGATAYFVTEVPELCPAILRQEVSSEGCDGEDTLERRLLESGENVVLPKALEMVCSGQVRLEGDKVIITRQSEPEKSDT